MARIEMSPSLNKHLVDWIRDSNPKGHEDVAADIKALLADLVDEHTFSKKMIEKRLEEHLSNFNIRFGSNSIQIWDSEVTLTVTGKDRDGSLTLDSSEFGSADELSRIAGYAEELENSVWDGEEGEELIEKWFDCE